MNYIQPLSKILKTQTPLGPTGRGVYFLLLGGQVVYIGCAVNVMQRVGTHTETKVFDSWAYLPLPDADMETLRAVEAAYILAMRPAYNGNGRGHLGLSISTWRIDPPSSTQCSVRRGTRGGGRR